MEMCSIRYYYFYLTPPPAKKHTGMEQSAGHGPACFCSAALCSLLH